MFVDTGATMKTGNLQYHLWIMSQYPEIVDDFFNVPMIPFMMLYICWLLWTSMKLLLIWITVKWLLSSSIIHNTHWLIKALSLYFALCNDVSLCSVLGLLTLLAMGAAIDLVQGYCHVLTIVAVFLLIYSH